MIPPNYDKTPFVRVSGLDDQVWQGWDAIAAEIRRAALGPLSRAGRAVIAMECYTGVFECQIDSELSRGIFPTHIIRSDSAFKTPDQIDQLVAPYIGNAPFGFLSPLPLDDFLDSQRRDELRGRIGALDGVILVIGTGATLCCDPDLIVYADMPRWEGQLRQRRGEVSNLGIANAGSKPFDQYRRSFFVDWRACDRLKIATMSRWDYLLDTTAPADPKLVTRNALRRARAMRAPALSHRAVLRSAPWGGQWMKRVCDLAPPQYPAANYGWCFDCVPEENSLLLRFGDVQIEIPAIDLVFYHPQNLLGDSVFQKFGAEFPIRFDLLDTFGGGNLSFQVHPTQQYAREAFGLSYTQDESYYILDAGEDGSVFLGLQNDINPADMLAALDRARSGAESFEAERYAARWPAKKHDHFLIPAGTVHCSGTNTLVLEISATPYNFTFKLWDWGRLGLDGHPRPISLEHGRRVIAWDRDRRWVGQNLVSKIEPLDAGPGWREQRTGCHSSQFIETRRHWFTDKIRHDTGGVAGGGVNVLNLVEGREAIVESPHAAFEPFVVHYAETFIIPAAVGAYTIRPAHTGTTGEHATIKAGVRMA